MRQEPLNWGHNDNYLSGLSRQCLAQVKEDSTDHITFLNAVDATREDRRYRVVDRRRINAVQSK